MAIQQMQRINVYALLRHCKGILETLQRKGAVQIEDVNIEDSVFYKEDTTLLRTSYMRSAAVAKQAYDVLCGYFKPKKSLLSSFKGRKLLSENEYSDYVNDVSEILRVAYEIIGYNKEIAECKGKIAKYENQITSLLPWRGLDVPMRFEGTKTTKAFVGTLPENLSEADIIKKLSELTSDDTGVSVEVISADKNQTCVFVLCKKEDEQEVFDALRKTGFSLPVFLSKETPKESINKIDKKIHKLKGEILELESNIKSYKGMTSAFSFLEDYFIMKAERYGVVDNLANTPHTFVLSGYIVKEKADELSKLLTERFDAYVELEDANGDEVPVVLKNNKFVSPVESVLKTYSLPNRHEVDPTAIMAIFYYFFFGIMFSDAGYGLVMALACGILLLKNKNMETGLKKTVNMFFWCGVSTIIWGALFGSFFGDSVSVICQTFLKMTPEQVPKIPGITTAIWFVPNSNPMKMLMFSFLFGIIHLFTGLGIKAYIDIKHKHFADAIYDVLSWYLLVGGGVLAILSMDMMENIAGFVLPSVFMKIGGISAAIGAVILLIFAGRTSKNPIIRLLKGLYEVYGATSYLSDILSYSRLLALGLATGVIAQVFNQIGAMLGSGFVGVMVFVIVFLIGHMLNIGINALGAYVHTNRLQFVEFFGKFYEGGGKEFKPFKINTKHFNIKEDI